MSGSARTPTILHGQRAAGTTSDVGRAADGHGQTVTPVAAHPLHAVIGIVDDVLLLVLIVFLVPLTILVIGALLALFVRVAIEVGRRLV